MGRLVGRLLDRGVGGLLKVFGRLILDWRAYLDDGRKSREASTEESGESGPLPRSTSSAARSSSDFNIVSPDTAEQSPYLDSNTQNTPSDSMPMPSNTALALLPLIPLQPTFPETQLSPLDTPYLHFFLSPAMQQKLLYGDLFPSFLPHILPRTLLSPPLLHAILAVSSAVADSALNRPPECALRHKARAIGTLQRSLGMGMVDEDIALAIFVLLAMDAFDPGHSAPNNVQQGVTVPQNHLRGFGLVLQQLGIPSTAAEEGSYLDGAMARRLTRLSPPMMLVWRMALRMDSGIALVQRTLPVLPDFPLSYNVQRDWISSLAKDGRSADLAVAAFALDAFVHRAVGWVFEGMHIKTSHPEYLHNPVFRAEYDDLWRNRMSMLRCEHKQWIQQPSVQESLRKELLAQAHPHTTEPANISAFSTSTDCFLAHPPLAIYDIKFTRLLTQWHSNAILLTLATHPPHQRTPSDLHHATQICRAHAAAKTPSDSSDPDAVAGLFALVAAGYVFAGNGVYRREFEWVWERVMRAVEDGGDGMEGFRAYFARVRGVHEGLQGWSLVDDEGIV